MRAKLCAYEAGIGVYGRSGLILHPEVGNRWQIVVLHFAAQPVGGTLRGSIETTDVRYFSQAETQDIPMSSFNRQRIADAFAGQTAAFVRDDIELA